MRGERIPDGFWVVWEGPPYRRHSLGDDFERCRGKGLKTICIAPTRTSALDEPMNLSFGQTAAVVVDKPLGPID